MKNGEIADVFDQVADLLEFQGENPFRLRAYRNAAATLRDLTESVAKIAKDPERKLTDLPGVGKDLADKIMTLVTTGELPLLAELTAKTPPSVLILLRCRAWGRRKPPCCTRICKSARSSSYAKRAKPIACAT